MRENPRFFHTKIMRFSLLSAFFATVISCNNNELPNVTIETEKGNIIIELYPEAAPTTVENFARLIEAGYYDGVTFHRYVPGFVIQGGDPEGTGRGGPGWTIPGEFQDPELRDKMPVHEKGVICDGTDTKSRLSRKPILYLHQFRPNTLFTPKRQLHHVWESY